MKLTDEFTKHLEKHILFPATGKDILDSFNQPSDLKDDIDMIKEKIDQQNTYHSVEDVKADLEAW